MVAGEEQARRFVVVSTDSHAGAKRLADFEPYVEPAFRERLASLYGASTELRLPGMMYGRWTRKSTKTTRCGALSSA